jgi:hypothetical protein
MAKQPHEIVATLVAPLNPLKAEFLHNLIYKSSLYLTGNTIRFRYKDQTVNVVYCENHTEDTSTLCGDNAEF